MSNDPRFEVVKTKRQGITVYHHCIAACCALLFGALAFGLPTDSASRLLEPLLDPPALGEVVQVALALPAAAETASATRLPEVYAWQKTTVEPGDNLGRIVERLGMRPEDLYTVMASCDEAKKLNKILPGQVFKIRTDGDGDLVEIVHEYDPEGGTRIFRNGSIFKAKAFKHTIEKRTALKTGVIDDSLDKALAAAAVSKKIRKQVKQALSHRLDFKKDIRSGARFSIVYEEDYFSGEKIGDADLLAVELHNAGRTHQAIAFRGHEDAPRRYYDSAGKSLEPAFLRVPVRYRRISSPFQPNRRHPVLGIRRPHWGTDFAAPSGTPVLAAADATVKTVERQRGYGKTIVLDHGRGYTTLYAHLSGYKKGLRVGTNVKKGQVIGYVGRTGLASGFHLHYEVRIDGQARNPLTVALPTEAGVAERYRQKFREHSRQLLAQMDLLERTQLAANHR